MYHPGRGGGVHRRVDEFQAGPAGVIFQQLLEEGRERLDEQAGPVVIDYLLANGILADPVVGSNLDEMQLVEARKNAEQDNVKDTPGRGINVFNRGVIAPHCDYAKFSKETFAKGGERHDPVPQATIFW
jgi:hypothetical protein